MYLFSVPYILLLSGLFFISLSDLRNYIPQHFSVTVYDEVRIFLIQRGSLIIQIPIDPATGEIHGTTIEEQAEQVMKNIGELLKAAGTDYTRVAKTSCFLADMSDFAAFNQVYAKYFTENPARSCVAVKTLPKNVLCEVEVIAEV